MNPEKKCFACGNEMIEGFLLDPGYYLRAFRSMEGGGQSTRWFEGKPDTTFLGTFKNYKDRKNFETSIFRCTKCGILAVYAED